MLAANEDYNPYVAHLTQMDAAQLRAVLATAGGLLAHKSSPADAYATLVNVAKTAWPNPTLRALAVEFCARVGMEMNELRGFDRDRNAAWPRQHFMYEAVKLNGKSLSAVGRFLNRDHTTVLHGVKAHEARMVL